MCNEVDFMMYTVGTVYYGYFRTNHKCSYTDYFIFQVSLHDKAPFGTITISVWIMQVS